MAVNPVQKGIDVVQENESIKMIKKVSAQDPAAKWAADTHVYGQACIMGGAACVNSINTYPNLALWESLDPERLYADVYNRYASIYIDITRDKTTFELEAADTFVAHVNVDDIEKLGITYFVSERNLDEYDTDKVDFTLVADTNSKLFVYRVDCV